MSERAQARLHAFVLNCVLGVCCNAQDVFPPRYWMRGSEYIGAGRLVFWRRAAAHDATLPSANLSKEVRRVSVIRLMFDLKILAVGLFLRDSEMEAFA